MQQTIKTCCKVAGLACLFAALLFSGCNSTSDKKSNSDSLASDSMVKKDSVSVVKKDTDSTSVKKTLVDSNANPPVHSPKKDTSVKLRPLTRKT